MVELATYLLCIEDIEQCVEFLDSFLKFDVDHARSDLWDDFGMAILLRAHIHFLAGEEDARLDRIKEVSSDDIVSGRLTRRDYLVSVLEDYEEFMAIRHLTSRRDLQRSFSYLFNKFLYLHEMTSVDPCDTTSADRCTIVKMLEKTWSELRDVLRA